MRFVVFVTPADETIIVVSIVLQRSRDGHPEDQADAEADRGGKAKRKRS